MLLNSTRPCGSTMGSWSAPGALRTQLLQDRESPSSTCLPVCLALFFKGYIGFYWVSISRLLCMAFGLPTRYLGLSCYKWAGTFQDRHLVQSYGKELPKRCSEERESITQHGWHELKAAGSRTEELKLMV